MPNKDNLSPNAGIIAKQWPGPSPAASKAERDTNTISNEHLKVPDGTEYATHKHKNLTRGTTKVQSSEFACPFLKYDPKLFHSCSRYWLENITDVEQHLREDHFAHLYLNCLKPFHTHDDLKHHIRFDSCSRLFSVNGATDHVRRGLCYNFTFGLTNETKWYIIWDTLFPDRARPETPYLDSEDSEDVSFQKFIMSHGPAILSPMLEFDSPKQGPYNLETTLRSGLELIRDGWIHSISPPCTISTLSKPGEISDILDLGMKVIKPTLTQLSAFSDDSGYSGSVLDGYEYELPISGPVLEVQKIDTHSEESITSEPGLCESADFPKQDTVSVAHHLVSPVSIFIEGENTGKGPENTSDCPSTTTEDKTKLKDDEMGSLSKMTYSVSTVVPNSSPASPSLQKALASDQNEATSSEKSNPGFEKMMLEQETTDGSDSDSSVSESSPSDTSWISAVSPDYTLDSSHPYLSIESIAVDRIVSAYKSWVCGTDSPEDTPSSGIGEDGTDSSQIQDSSASSQTLPLSQSSDPNSGEKRSSTKRPRDNADDAATPQTKFQRKKIQKGDTRLACPFQKQFPCKHFRCGERGTTPGFDTIAHMKEHIKRRHLRPLHCCSICKKVFPKSNELYEHNIAAQIAPCEIRSFTDETALPWDKDVLQALGKRANKHLDICKQWYAVWDSIFSGASKPLSCYIDDESYQYAYEYHQFQVSRGLEVARAIVQDMNMEITSQMDIVAFVEHVCTRAASQTFDIWKSERNEGSQQRLPSSITTSVQTPISPENSVPSANDTSDPSHHLPLPTTEPVPPILPNNTAPAGGENHGSPNFWDFLNNDEFDLENLFDWEETPNTMDDLLGVESYVTGQNEGRL